MLKAETDILSIIADWYLHVKDVEDQGLNNVYHRQGICFSFISLGHSVWSSSEIILGCLKSEIWVLSRI